MPPVQPANRVTWVSLGTCSGQKRKGASGSVPVTWATSARRDVLAFEPAPAARYAPNA
jgi:hypothetical protein